jgi:hypothetical protein
MTENDPLAFSRITPEQFATLCAKAKDAGIELDGSSGTTSKYGVEVRWDYDTAQRRLVLEVLKTPFFIDAADVYAKLRSLVNQSLA